ncbi:MAG TPA: metal-dependent hydrolase [Elusimicrobia bacterium]|nr:MAG: hypothetical protein A2X40_01540 [Elusimicrobia bacterium GWC2_65_9]HAZ06983.1 metal-dependent hydrolase [Elusimicrobiota bacterium]
MESPAAILDEVRGFLDGLRREWPEVFLRRRPRTRFRSAPSVAAMPAAPRSAPAEGGLEAHFHARASFWAERLGVTFGAVRVKDQRSLWGSCSRRGNLNFNWRLSLAPSEVQDYVVIHELAHRLEMNHSRDFWAVVERVCVQHKAHRRWLRKNGARLYGVSRPVPRAS